MKIQIKDKVLKFVLVMGFMLVPVFFANYQGIYVATARTLQQLQNELEKSKNQMDRLDRSIQVYQNKINEVKLEINSLEEELDNLDKNITLTDEVILDTVYRIDAKRRSINYTTKDIYKGAIEIEKQKKILKEIVQEMYKASEEGKINLLELLLYSGNYKDALNDVEYFDILHNQGEESLVSIEQMKNQLESKKKILEVENVSLSELLESLEYSKEVLKNHEEAKNLLLEQTKGEEEEYVKLKEEARMAQQKMESELKRIEKEMEAEKERLAKMKRLDLNAGELMWPTDGRITAYFMDPTYPFIHILGQHMGIDIAAPVGTAIYAAHDGIVSIGYMENGYGKYIVNTINSADGGTVTTLYGHLSKIYVENGAEVKKGQQIGEMGSTGFSTGSHLHFELRNNRTPVNPLIYLP
jgi:murein DD-endopeptidase MepM/ murein hydrolase activator NlpD